MNLLDPSDPTFWYQVGMIALYVLGAVQTRVLINSLGHIPQVIAKRPPLPPKQRAIAEFIFCASWPIVSLAAIVFPKSKRRML